MSQLGLVIIGRNEGDRLRSMFFVGHKSSKSIVYVDSGSSDGSVAMAQSLGVDVVS